MGQQVTNLGLAVLELLLERPMHPYEMHRTIRMRHTDRVVKLKRGSLYHVVERLERLGLVEAVETERAGRRPERTTYRITDAGRETYETDVLDLVASVEEEYPAFPVGLALGHDLGHEQLRDALERRRADLERIVEENREGVTQVTRIGLPQRHWLDLRFTLAMAEAELGFVVGLLDDIERGRVSWEEQIPARSDVSEGFATRVRTGESGQEKR